MVGIPVAGPARSSLFQHTQMTMLSLEGEGGMARQPGVPRFLNFRRHRLWWMVGGMQNIQVMLGRPEKYVRRWFWHGLLVHNRFHPQHPNTGEYSKNVAGKQAFSQTINLILWRVFSGW